MPPVCGSSVAASKSAAERRGQGSADDPDTGEFRADAADGHCQIKLHWAKQE